MHTAHRPTKARLCLNGAAPTPRVEPKCRVYHGACQEPETAGIPSNRVALTLVHKHYVWAEARKQDEAAISEDDGAGESDAEACEAGEDGEEDALTAADEAAAAPYALPTTEHDDDDDLCLRADEHALPAVAEPASASAPFLYDGADPNAGLVGRCSTCGGPTHADVELCRCGRVNHRRCLATVARGRHLCRACVARDRRLPDVLTLVEVCAGMGTAAAALHMLSSAGALSGFETLAAVERAHHARDFLEHLGEEMPGVRPRNLIADLLHVVTAERADLCVAGASAGPARLSTPRLGRGLAALRTQVCRAAPSATTLTATPTIHGGWTTWRPAS